MSIARTQTLLLKPLLAGGCLLVLFAANWQLVVSGATETGARLEHGGLSAARAGAATEMVQLLSSGRLSREAIYTYLQVQHLTQSAGPREPLQCARLAPRARAQCVTLENASAFYAGGKISTRQHYVPLTRGSDRHVVLQLHAAGQAAPMVLDTGSLATILPRSFEFLAQRKLQEIRVRNMGRSISLHLVKTSAFSIAGVSFPSWIAATSEVGFAAEGVIGLDLIHGLGGFEIDLARERVTLAPDACGDSRAVPFQLRDGALTVPVQIDGVRHLAHVDTGSVRSFVYSPQPSARTVALHTDFGNVELSGEFRSSVVELGGRRAEVPVVYVAERSRFYGDTTALIGNDVLLGGQRMGVCFDPGRIWVE